MNASTILTGLFIVCAIAMSWLCPDGAVVLFLAGGLWGYLIGFFLPEDRRRRPG
jgi:hypothetical protein